MPSGDSGVWAADVGLEVIDAMLEACDRHWQRLVDGGCNMCVAFDRVWDAWDAVVSEDGRDVLFDEDRQLIGELRAIKENSNAKA